MSENDREAANSAAARMSGGDGLPGHFETLGLWVSWLLEWLCGG
jgi:hypothetical protein